MKCTHKGDSASAQCGQLIQLRFHQEVAGEDFLQKLTHTMVVTTFQTKVTCNATHTFAHLTRHVGHDAINSATFHIVQCQTVGVESFQGDTGHDGNDDERVRDGDQFEDVRLAGQVVRFDTQKDDRTLVIVHQTVVVVGGRAAESIEFRQVHIRRSGNEHPVGFDATCVYEKNDFRSIHPLLSDLCTRHVHVQAGQS